MIAKISNTRLWSKMVLVLTVTLIYSCKDDDDMMVITPEVETEANITVYDADRLTDDYVLVSPFRGNTSFLINREGNVLQRWSSSESTLMGYLREDGSVVRSVVTGVDNGIIIGGKTGAIEIIDKNNNQIWKWELDTSTEALHHDIALLPNGNILASVWVVKDRAECIANGRDPNTIVEDRLVIDKVIEIEPVGTNQANIVWEWSLWDHLVQDFDSNQLNFGDASNGSLFDINQSTEGINFTHVNGLDYIPSLDQIILNSRVLDEFIIIDHDLTTQQAATNTGGRYNKGGQILYRWGNPESYNSGTSADRQLHDQHDTTFVGDNILSRGTFLVFDNQDDPNFSTIKEVNINVTADGVYPSLPGTGNNPSTPVWSYSSEEITSPRTSGVQRLPSGNSLITSTSGDIIREVNYAGDILWELDTTIEVDGVLEIDSSGFKSRSYPKNFAGVTALGL
ncbi:arylsulfotransferase ASST [Nonlabens dokdonensis]|uniref:Uncharacterized protein n=2 Tax=Nonlabens dokdonensis TaxID=328515 RepID=L7W5X1_NONDD|nr:aryl-sulfate sulfotransferase [Nonlabens dokdonensis]AGC77070.1 hypothetical protein DDD_1943 [Nonlabens dokdonensis DSW-6]PZX41031.1 arylsulfotransferase ASST [Nonlabens dokdonensis]